MVRRSRGFSLIELMVTLTILAILMLTGAQYTMAWVYGARVNETKSKLLQAYALAKALAQRNPGDIRVPSAAAGLKLADGVLYVCPGNPATATTCNQWHADLPANTTVTFGDNQILGLDNTGKPLATSSFSITNGSQNDSGEFH